MDSKYWGLKTNRVKNHDKVITYCFDSLSDSERICLLAI